MISVERAATTIAWICLGLGLVGCSRKSESSASANPRAAASVAAPARPSSANATSKSGAAATMKWPLPHDCDIVACTVGPGEPGVRCGPSGPCGNPCPAGMAPEASGGYCARRCRTAADCGGDPCTAEGVCDRWPREKPTCDAPEFCELSGGRGMGVRCGSGPCVPSCKKGLVLTGGTHCAKPCKSNADCPGGECDEVCGPLCPSEGCPYRWE